MHYLRCAKLSEQAPKVGNRQPPNPLTPRPAGRTMSTGPGRSEQGVSDALCDRELHPPASRRVLVARGGGNTLSHTHPLSGSGNETKQVTVPSFLRDDETGNHLFYTTPTKPADIYPYIEYTLTMKSRPLGVLDRAGNEWDMNNQTDAYENKVTWTFGIAANGNFTNWAEALVWENW